jgi:hypothetical protein
MDYDSPMSSDEYRQALDKLGLSQTAAAPFLGVSPRTSQSFALGEATVHRSIALLLRTMVKLKLTIEDIEKMPKIKTSERQTTMTKTNQHHTDYLRRRNEQPPSDTRFKVLNRSNPWRSTAPGHKFFNAVVEAKPESLSAVYAVARLLKITEREAWKHLAWVDTWKDAGGYPFVQIG